MIFLYSHDETVRARWEEALSERDDVQVVSAEQPLAAALAGFTEGVVLADPSSHPVGSRLCAGCIRPSTWWPPT